MEAGAITVALAGWVVKTGAWFTTRTAALLVTLPTLLVAVTV